MAHRILIAEDDPLVRSALHTVLTHLGFEVVEAPDGAQALALLAVEAPFDLVLLDQEMPRLDGRAARVRIAQLHPGLPVVLCTGADACEPGEAVLLKPFGLKDVRALLRRFGLLPAS